MAAIAYETHGGAPYPQGTKELFIGPARVRVVVKGGEQEALWRQAHQNEWQQAQEQGTAPAGPIPSPD